MGYEVWAEIVFSTFCSSGQKSVLVLCMKIFPLWLFLMLTALGVIKLPFDIPGLDMDNLLM
jgi:hypothetical protein